jgi:hypothetical protein
MKSLPTGEILSLQLTNENPAYINTSNYLTISETDYSINPVNTSNYLTISGMDSINPVNTSKVLSFELKHYYEDSLEFAIVLQFFHAAGNIF